MEKEGDLCREKIWCGLMTPKEGWKKHRVYSAVTAEGCDSSSRAAAASMAARMGLVAEMVGDEE